MTTGDDSRIINLGLGGYFQIQSVSHTIGPSGYNVSMKALQEGMEIGPQPMVEASVIAGDITPGEGDWDTAPAPDPAGAGSSPPDENETAVASALQTEEIIAAADVINARTDLTTEEKAMQLLATTLSQQVEAGTITAEKMIDTLRNMQTMNAASSTPEGG
jgi:hypothetical protein